MKYRAEQNQENPIKTGAMVFLIVILYVVAFPFLIPGILRSFSLRVKFHEAAVTQKKFIIFVYSNSPIWKSYLEENIIPKIQDHAIILNWSNRNHWDQNDWTVRSFHHWGGREDFNPLAIIFCHFLNVRVIRFYRAFHDFKHGKVISLHEAEAQLLDLSKANIYSRPPK